MTKKNLPYAGYDLALIFPAFILVGIGIVMVYSASSAIAVKKFGTDYFFFKKQIIYALIGMLGLILFKNIPINFFREATYPLLFLALVFLLAVFTSFGFSAGGARRWLHIGKFSFQPSEFARFAMIIYMAYSLSKKREKLKEFSIGFLPHIIILGIFSFLILLQPDFGSAMILGTLTWIMMFIGGVRILHLSTSFVCILPAIYFFIMGADYRLQRIMSFLNPWESASSSGYQIVHSLMAFGSGGIFGTGIGKGYQKLFYLPEPHTDFIFSVIGEELGLLGVLLTLLLYGIVIYRGIRISLVAQDQFSSYLAAGLTCALALQVCVNMAVAMSLLPTKGLTLPLISYGGTSLILQMASIGILNNIRANHT